MLEELLAFVPDLLDTVTLMAETGEVPEELFALGFVLDLLFFAVVGKAVAAKKESK